MDRSLRSKSLLERHRNVLSRAERVARLMDHDQWSDEMSALGLPKIAHRKAHTSKKAKVKAEGEEQPQA